MGLQQAVNSFPFRDSGHKILKPHFSFQHVGLVKAGKCNPCLIDLHNIEIEISDNNGVK